MSPLSVNHNLMAYGVSRQLSAHYDTLADSVRRLSTGLRVERAADDAAGLAIRELMRADIRALGQGTRNANDAISLIQTADGALAIIDEKLIRMKELAEQAATGTYDSTQRLIIDSEFQQMASEIDRIAKATDFNGVKLLDGALSGRHDGTGAGSADGLSSTGALKVHFGTANDSAEDYYYIQIGDCTLAGLGLREGGGAFAAQALAVSPSPSVQAGASPSGEAVADADGAATNRAGSWEGSVEESGMKLPELNNLSDEAIENTSPRIVRPYGKLETIDDLFGNKNGWFWTFHETKDGKVEPDGDFMFLIPKGTKNILINILSTEPIPEDDLFRRGDNDIELFTTSGVHLAGTPLGDVCIGNYNIDSNATLLGFDSSQYDGSNLNSGPNTYDQGKTLKYSTYNGMVIGYSGDGESHDAVPNNAKPSIYDYEVLTIDEATEDLIVWFPQYAATAIQAYYNLPDQQAVPDPPGPGDPPLNQNPAGDIISIKTQELAQRALNRLDNAIVRKDQVRAHLGAMQNRLENTVTNLSVQAESLQAAESRISDVDVATEMTTFVRNQVLTQSATSMLAQANAFPHMLLQLLQG